MVNSYGKWPYPSSSSEINIRHSSMKLLRDLASVYLSKRSCWGRKKGGWVKRGGGGNYPAIGRERKILVPKKFQPLNSHQLLLWYTFMSTTRRQPKKGIVTEEQSIFGQAVSSSWTHPFFGSFFPSLPIEWLTSFKMATKRRIGNCG